MSKIRIPITHQLCNLHCQCCGGDDFTKLSTHPSLGVWYRCKHCGTDVQPISSGDSFRTVSVLDVINNKIHERFIRNGSK